MPARTAQPWRFRRRSAQRPGSPPVNKPIHAAILGGSGYGAGELLRLLVNHPAVAVVSVTSRSHAGLPIRRTRSAPSRLLRPDGHRKSRPPAVPGRRTRRAVFGPAARRQRGDAGWAFGGALTPNSPIGQGGPGDSLEELRVAHVKAIDLSGDLRLKDAGVHKKVYPGSPGCRMPPPVRLRPARVEPRADPGEEPHRQSGLPGDGGDPGRGAVDRSAVSRPTGDRCQDGVVRGRFANRKIRLTTPPGTPISAPTSRWLTGTSRRYSRPWATL